MKTIIKLAPKCLIASLFFCLTLGNIGFAVAEDEQIKVVVEEQKANVASELSKEVNKDNASPGISVEETPSENEVAKPKTVAAPKESTAENQKPNMSASSKEKFNLDFNDASIADIARQIAELKNKNLILDQSTPNINSKVTLISPVRVTIDEAYNAFLAALSLKGLTVEESGKFLKIIPSADAKYRVITDGKVSNNEEIITKLIPIKYLSAQEMAKTLALMVKDGAKTIIPNEPTNSLIISDTKSNIDRLVTIIGKLDVRGNEENVKMYKIKYASAKIVAEQISKVLSLGGATSPSTPSYSSPFSSRYGASSSDKSVSGSKVISKIIADDRTNSLLIKANDEGHAEISSLVSQLDTDISNERGTPQPWIYRMQYGDAPTIAETLSSILSSSTTVRRRPSSSSSSEGGPSYYPYSYTRPNPGEPPKIGGDEEIKVTSDEKTNSLIVVATREGYYSLLPTIKELDRRREQVHIAASIMEVTLSNNLELGTTGHGGWAQTGGKGITAFGGSQFGSGFSSSQMSMNPGMLASLSGLVTGFSSNPINIGKNFSIPGFAAVLRANRVVTDAKFLSRPSILALNNQKSKIEVGEEVWIPTSVTVQTDKTTIPQQNFEKEKATLALEITPHISNNKSVTMEIKQDIREYAPRTDPKKGEATNAMRTRSTQTTALAESGETIVLGGLIQEKNRTSISKVPLLGDIPVLGYLFKDKSTSKEKTNLIMFITPSVISDSTDMANVTKKEIDKRKQFYEKNKIQSDDWIGTNEKTTHPAGIVITYQDEKAKTKPNYDKNTETYFEEDNGIYTFPGNK